MEQDTARSTRKLKLTDRNVRVLAVNGRTDYTDELVRGFRLRVGTDGSRVYSVGYFAGGRWKRYTIGRVGDLTLARARDTARQLRARARLGEDPQAEKISQRQADQTFARDRGPDRLTSTWGLRRRHPTREWVPLQGISRLPRAAAASVRPTPDISS